jgi:hypothetical protein
MKTLRITTHWTTEQAEDMFALLDDLKSAIWQSYGEEMSYSQFWCLRIS